MQIEQDVAGTKPDLDAYFQSISKAFETSLAAEASRTDSYDGTPVTIGFFLFLLFSLIPALPALGYFISHWISKPLTLTIWRLHLSVHSFLFWYLTISALSALLFGIRLKYSSVQQKKNKPTFNAAELLSEPQMRFALCYSVRSEIDAYRTNKRNIHIEKARSFWRKLLISLRDALGSGSDYWRDSWTGMPRPEVQFIYPDEVRRRLRKEKERFFPQVHKLLTTFPWFKLDARTESILLAFDGLRSKLSGRLRDKEDLFQVSNCLFPFSLYLYTQIPDISDTKEEKATFLAFQELALDAFVHEMTLLNNYTPAVRVNTKIEHFSVNKAKVGGILSSTVGNSSPFLRFASMWILLQVFVGIAVSVFLATVKTLKLDSTLIALLIGSPFAIAAALTAIPTPTRVESKKVD
jgi:hypothetical protein